MEEERKKERKEKKKKRGKLQKNCKSPTWRQRFIATVENVNEYTHIHIYS